jgi:hypothetical protein
MLYLFINVNIFTIYCCLKFLFNFISKTLHNFNVILRKSSYAHISKNNIVFLYKLLIVIKLLI